MADPKRHHYLPRFYLERFTDKGTLWVFDRQRSQYRPQKPINTAVEGHRYAVEMEDGSKSAEIEKFFAVIEGQAKAAIEKLDAKQVLSIDEKGVLSWFLAAFISRVPEFEAGFDAATKSMTKKHLQIKYSSEEAIDRLFDSMKAESGEESALSREAVRQMFVKGQFEAGFDRTHYLQTMIEIANECALIIEKLDWVVLHAPPKKTFVTSDRPFVVIPPKKQSAWYGTGLLTPGATKIAPLGAGLCLLLGEPGDRVVHRDADRDGMRTMNLAVASRCYEYLIGRDERLVRSLVETTGIDKRPPSASISAG